MFSQFGQDDFVVQTLGSMTHGFFVEAGAYDGVLGSNTLLLEREFGWNGICIEPNEQEYAKLRANRRCACVCACLYDREVEVDFLEGAASGGGIMQEYHPSHLDYVVDAYNVPLNAASRPVTVAKMTRTLGSVLDKGRARPVIDYLSLDVEGAELAILRTFPFDRYQVRLLTVEHCWLPNREKIRQFLEARGFRRVGSLGLDDCYLGPVMSRQGSWRSLARRR